MSWSRRLGALAATSCLLLPVAGVAGERTAGPGSAFGGAPPRLLVLRVWESSDPGLPLRRVDVVDPWFVRDLLDSDVLVEPAEEDAAMAPRLGPGYRLMQTFTPDPREPRLRYYFYHFDMGDPFVARNFRELQRAERAEDRQARAERRAERAWERRRMQLLRSNYEVTRMGLAELQAGQYRQAVITLTRAAELDHSDAASRLHLAQARLALGHDAEAAAALRRALELQPKLVPMELELEATYPSPADFAAQVDALAARLLVNPRATADEYFLLGFMEFQRGRMDQAHAAFRKARRGLPDDEHLEMYLDLTKPAVPLPQPAAARLPSTP